MVRDAATGAAVAEARVTILDADGQTFRGEADLRGVYSAEGPSPVISVLARVGAWRYAYRRLAPVEPVSNERGG